MVWIKVGALGLVLVEAIQLDWGLDLRWVQVWV